MEKALGAYPIPILKYSDRLLAKLKLKRYCILYSKPKWIMTGIGRLSVETCIL